MGLCRFDRYYNIKEQTENCKRFMKKEDFLLAAYLALEIFPDLLYTFLALAGVMEW